MLRSHLWVKKGGMKERRKGVGRKEGREGRGKRKKGGRKKEKRMHPIYAYVLCRDVYACLLVQKQCRRGITLLYWLTQGVGDGRREIFFSYLFCLFVFHAAQRMLCF